MIADYIGISFNELDCYALVRKFYKNELNIDLIDVGCYYKDYNNDSKFLLKSHLVFQEYAKQWQKVDDVQFGDVIAMRLDSRLPRIVTHFAIVINKSEMIHTTINGDSRIEPINRYKNLIEGFYRHADSNI